MAVNWRGEVYSLSRWLDIKTKALKEQLGEPEQRVHTFTDEIKQNHQRRIFPLLAQKEKMVKRHQKARKLLAEKQNRRQQQEIKRRKARLKKGYSKRLGSLDWKTRQSI